MHVHTANIHEAKTNLSKLLQYVKMGDEVLICKAGEPMARLIPVQPTHNLEKRQSGGLAGKMWVADDFDEMPEELKKYFGMDEQKDSE